MAKQSKNLTNGKSVNGNLFGISKGNYNIQTKGFGFAGSLVCHGANKLIKKKVEEYNNFDMNNKNLEEKMNDLLTHTDTSLENEEEKKFKLLPLNEKIDVLDLEIMYYEKKNKRPLSFILDRFNIKDEILVKLIKIFEFSLEEVVFDYKRSLKENIFFQLKLLNKYEIKKNKKV